MLNSSWLNSERLTDMAIIFNGTSSYLRSGDFGTTRPSAYSIATWFKTTSVANTSNVEMIAMVGSAAGDRGDLYLEWGHPALNYRNRPAIHTTGTTYPSTNTAGANTANVWRHWAAVYSGSNVIFYQNGIQIGATLSATVTAPAPADWYFSMGADSSLAGSWLSCKQVMAGYWDIGLSAADVAALAAGFPPENVRPQSLQSYFSGLRDAKNYRGTGWTEASLTFDDDNPKIML
jgi:hypothetical protein